MIDPEDNLVPAGNSTDPPEPLSSPASTHAPAVVVSPTPADPRDPLGAIDHRPEARACGLAPWSPPEIRTYPSLDAIPRPFIGRVAGLFGAKPLPRAIRPSDDYGDYYPPYGTPDVWTGQPDGRGGYVNPSAYLPVILKGSSLGKLDKQGVPLRWRFRQFAYLLGRACGICLVEVAREVDAWWHVNVIPSASVVGYSVRNQAGYGSQYWAVDTQTHMALRQFFIGDSVKRELGGGPLHGINAIRFFLRSIVGYAMLGQTDNTLASLLGLPDYAAGNPAMGGPLKPPHLGFTADEARRLSRWGRGWLARTGTKDVYLDKPLAA